MREPTYSGAGWELYVGDSLEILPTLGRFDACVTDPPYGIGASFDVCRHGHGQSDWDASPPTAAAFAAIRNCCDEQIIWGGNYFELPPSRGFLVWDKCQPEAFTLAMAEYAWWSRDHNAKLFRYPAQKLVKVHPTQKPVALMEWCLSFLPNAETILDPFAGSGTTGIACIKSGCRFIGIEIDEHYAQIAANRLARAEADVRNSLPFPEPEPQPKQVTMWEASDA